MYTLTVVTVCAVLAQSPWGKPERCVRFDILRSLATVEECYRREWKTKSACVAWRLKRGIS